MPTYEYVCESCGHRFDEFQSMKDDPLKVCPKCDQTSLRRLFGCGAAVLFKGSGFYETDYRSEAYKSAAKADQEAASKTPSTGSNGTSSTSGTTSSTPPAANSPGKTDSKSP
jgi:putative FmdB family regulatory protein